MSIETDYKAYREANARANLANKASALARAKLLKTFGRRRKIATGRPVVLELSLNDLGQIERVELPRGTILQRETLERAGYTVAPGVTEKITTVYPQ